MYSWSTIFFNLPTGNRRLRFMFNFQLVLHQQHQSPQSISIYELLVSNSALQQHGGDWEQWREGVVLPTMSYHFDSLINEHQLAHQRGYARSILDMVFVIFAKDNTGTPPSSSITPFGTRGSPPLFSQCTSARCSDSKCVVCFTSFIANGQSPIT